MTSLGQKITFITTEGRMYLLCDNYAEVFGFTGKNKLRKINNLDVMNMREKEIVIGLFKLYDALIDKYMELYKIDKKKEKNLNTKIFEEIVKNNKLDNQTINVIKQTKLLKNVEFDKIEKIANHNQGNTIEQAQLQSTSQDREISGARKSSENGIKFYI